MIQYSEYGERLESRRVMYFKRPLYNVFKFSNQIAIYSHIRTRPL
jgi:hypothetical protein